MSMAPPRPAPAAAMLAAALACGGCMGPGAAPGAVPPAAAVPAAAVPAAASPPADAAAPQDPAAIRASLFAPAPTPAPAPGTLSGWTAAHGVRPAGAVPAGGRGGGAAPPPPAQAELTAVNSPVVAGPAPGLRAIPMQDVAPNRVAGYVPASGPETAARRGPTTPEAQARAAALFAPVPTPGAAATPVPAMPAAPAPAPAPAAQVGAQVAAPEEDGSASLAAQAGGWFAGLFGGSDDAGPEAPELGVPRPASPAQLAEARAAVARAEADLAAAQGPGLASERGQALLAAGRPEPAARAFGQAIVAEGPTPEALIGLGAAYRELGRRGPALEVLTRAAETWPDNPAARNNRGAVLFDMGRLDKAEAEFRAAAELMARRGLAPSAEISRNLAMIARARGQSSTAPAPSAQAASNLAAPPAPAAQPAPAPAGALAPLASPPPPSPRSIPARVPRPESEA